MLLVDSSVWIDHLRKNDLAVAAALNEGKVLSHPHVIGEIALGSMKDRSTVLSLMQGLPKAKVASEVEVLSLIESNQLFGRGIGYTDAHLIASTLLTEDALLWTRDKRLQTVALELELHVE